MKNWILGALGALLIGSAVASAQSSPAPPPAPSAAAVFPVWPDSDSPTWGASSDSGPLSFYGDTDPAPRLWVNTDYLLWWVKRSPSTPPLLTTTASPGAVNAGAVGADGTQILIGGHGLDYGTFSGLRLNLGGWLGEDRTLGLEAGGFLLERRTASAGFTSDGTPNALTFFSPAVEVAPPLGNVAFLFPATGPGLVTTARLTSQSRLWGAEGNLAVNVLRNPHWNADLLGGFRCADLEENLHYDTKSEAVTDPGTNLTTSDTFGTQNRFYGGQLGVRVEYQRGRLFANAVAKLALGATHESITIGGTALSTTPEGTISLAEGGIFTGASNIGRVTQDRFAVIPELGLTAGVQLTSHSRAFVGYNFLYWSDVVRPGSQVDTRVDFSSATPLVPVNPRTTTDFWAQGINFGLEFRY
jgi:Putative beta barrel porin-7 (BBP7)